MATLGVLDETLTQAVASTQASDWKYIAEGAANLMVAYNPAPSGKCQLNLRNKCLRLRKRAITSAIEKPTLTQNHGQEDCTRKNGDGAGGTDDKAMDEISFLDFHQHVICALINPAHLLQFQMIKLDPHWLHSLNAFIEPTRPTLKRSQECLDTDLNHALIMENLTISQTDDAPNVENLAIEIKPKWAFLPQAPSLLDPVTRDIKTKFCRTCVFRAVRSLSPKIHEQANSRENLSNQVARYGAEDVKNFYYVSSNRFCALQLFDEHTPVNLRCALDKLCKEWKWQNSTSLPSRPINPQSQPKPSHNHNNFKIFRDGIMIDPLSTELDPKAIDVLAKALEESKVLRRLAYLQRRLDPIDIEGIFKSAEDEEMLTELPKLSKVAIKMAELEEILLLLSEKIEPQEFQGLFELLTIRQKVVMYGLSMTFKDCSIFVQLPIDKHTFDSQSIIKPHVEEGKHRLDQISIKVIDLDLKPLSKLPKYFENDRKIFTRFKQSFLDHSACAFSTQTQSKPPVPVTCQEICGHGIL